MRILPAVLHLAILLLICLGGCKKAEEDKVATSESPQQGYITAEKYLLLHPEQAEPSRAFENIVQATAQPIDPALQEGSVKIAIVYPGQQASDYWRRSLKSFAARMFELGIRHEITEYFSKAGGQETRKQEQQLKEALEQDPDYLVFTLDVSQHLRAIERILSQKRPYLILQNITTPLARWEGHQPFHVGFDHAIGTRMLADYFLENAPRDGSYGLLYYSQGYVSEMRGDTFLSFMAEGNGPILADSYYTEGKRDQAKQAALDLLKQKALRFIYNCSTDVALGAIDAVREQQKTGSLLLNGWGGGSAELAALKNGDLDVTVMRMNDDNGVAMAEAIHLRLLGREEEIPTVFSGKFAILTQETSTSEIERLQQQAFRYSGIDRVEK